MSIRITTGDRISMSGSWENDVTLITQVLGEAVMPSITLGLSYGTGDGQVDSWHLALRTLGPGETDLLDLYSGLYDPEGNPANFGKLKRCVVSIQSPDGAKKLHVGPQGQVGAARLWAGGVGAENYEEVFSFLWKERPIDGWDVAADEADKLAIHNPTGDSITYGVWLLGIASSASSSSAAP